MSVVHSLMANACSKIEATEGAGEGERDIRFEYVFIGIV